MVINKTYLIGLTAGALAFMAFITYPYQNLFSSRSQVINHTNYHTSTKDKANTGERSKSQEKKKAPLTKKGLDARIIDAYNVAKNAKNTNSPTQEKMWCDLVTLVDQIGTNSSSKGFSNKASNLADDAHFEYANILLANGKITNAVAQYLSAIGKGNQDHNLKSAVKLTELLKSKRRNDVSIELTNSKLSVNAANLVLSDLARIYVNGLVINAYSEANKQYREGIPSHRYAFPKSNDSSQIQRDKFLQEMAKIGVGPSTNITQLVYFHFNRALSGVGTNFIGISAPTYNAAMKLADGDSQKLGGYGKMLGKEAALYLRNNPQIVRRE